MRQKNTEKHREKKSVKSNQSELFSIGGTKPIDQQWASAAQLFPFTGFDEPKLRRLGAQELRPDGKPWLPKPTAGKFPVAQTLIACREYREHQSASAGDGLPDFASMELCETAGHIPRTMQKWAQKRGCNFLKKGHRVDYDLLLAWLAENLFEPMFSGDTSKISALGIAGAAAIDGEYEKNRGIQLDNERKQREEDEAKGILQKREDCDAEIWGRYLLPFRNDLFKLAKAKGIEDDMKKLIANHYQNLPAEKLELETAAAK